MNPYESARLLGEYLLFHYGGEKETFGTGPGPREGLHFAERAVNDLIDPTRLPANATAIDIGCAVGRSTFELARLVSRAKGMDFSRSFIGAAQELAAAGERESAVAVEGERSEPFTARVPAGIDRSRVEFAVGDAMDVPAAEPACDVVLAANLICRLPEPIKFLRRLPSLVKSGGQLLLTTPFSWLEEFTPRANWIMGARGSFEALREILAQDFALEVTRDLPFVIREHARKFQFGVAMGSRWIRQ